MHYYTIRIFASSNKTAILRLQIMEDLMKANIKCREENRTMVSAVCEDDKRTYLRGYVDGMNGASSAKARISLVYEHAEA